jgi:ribonuclease HI
MAVIVVYCDGLCEPRNPGGTATYGWVAYVNGEKIHEECAVVCSGSGATNNVAEYSAVIAALEWLVKEGYAKEPVKVRSDSQLCMYQLSGVYAVRSERIRPLYEKARALSRKFRKVTFEWVPRENNQVADALSRKAYADYHAQLSFGAARAAALAEREVKAREIVGNVTHLQGSRYKVASQSEPGLFYIVDAQENSCGCPDFVARGKEIGACKHLLAVKMYLDKIGSAVL